MSRISREPLSIEELHLRAPKSGQIQVEVLAWPAMLGSKTGPSTIDIDVPEVIRMYGTGHLLPGQMPTGTYTTDASHEAIAPVKNGQAVRNVLVLNHDVMPEIN